MTSPRMTSHCMASRCGVHSLLGLCEWDCSINMLNFNNLRFIVYEIFDNSQLLLTDPRTSWFRHLGRYKKTARGTSNFAKCWRIRRSSGSVNESPGASSKELPSKSEKRSSVAVKWLKEFSWLRVWDGGMFCAICQSCPSMARGSDFVSTW